ncbi:unnamed protein product [Pleuronectes platessa]|uniref:Uncharacterized protein n=1 Tax=Pleuronectes platessa TaxID=8262 RepID=A0A9N7VGH0_PLEPL|nr:unnamed protein product [Pleuronectes platessa]
MRVRSKQPGFTSHRESDKETFYPGFHLSGYKEAAPPSDCTHVWVLSGSHLLLAVWVDGWMMCIVGYIQPSVKHSSPAHLETLEYSWPESQQLALLVGGMLQKASEAEGDFERVLDGAFVSAWRGLCTNTTIYNLSDNFPSRLQRSITHSGRALHIASQKHLMLVPLVSIHLYLPVCPPSSSPSSSSSSPENGLNRTDACEKPP